MNRHKYAGNVDGYIDGLLSTIEEFDARLRNMSKFSDSASICTVRSMLKEELEDRGIAIPVSMGR